MPADQVAPDMTPVLPWLVRSPRLVPVPSLKLYAATRPGTSSALRAVAVVSRVPFEHPVDNKIAATPHPTDTLWFICCSQLRSILAVLRRLDKKAQEVRQTDGSAPIRGQQPSTGQLPPSFPDDAASQFVDVRSPSHLAHSEAASVVIPGCCAAGAGKIRAPGAIFCLRSLLRQPECPTHAEIAVLVCATCAA
jgi:hypothetical protein